MMPMKKKTFTAAITISLLLISIFICNIDFVTANPLGMFLPHDPHTTVSLGNRTIFSDSIYLVFNLNLNQWYTSIWTDPGYFATVSSIEYYLDKVLAGNLTFTRRTPKSFSVPLTFDGLANGAHRVELKITTDGEYLNKSIEAGSTVWSVLHTQLDYYSVDFSIYVRPRFPNLSIENITYFSPDIPLSLNVDESTFWLGYNLDGQSTVTMLGNTTLTGLSDGSHSLFIYSRDLAGNIEKSDTVFFTVKTPTPTPSPSPSPTPSPSLTIEPTLEPTQTATPTNGDNQTLDLTPIILVAVIAIAVAMGAVVYFKRRKG